LDLRLNDYFEAVNEAVGSWIHGDGVSHQLNWAWHELAVIERLFPPTEGTAAYTEELRSATRASNELLFTTVEESALAWERGEGRAFPTVALKTASRRFVEQLLEKRNTFIARNQHVLLEALAREKMSGPIVSPQIF
jgi:hypothetical protein